LVSIYSQTIQNNNQANNQNEITLKTIHSRTDNNNKIYPFCVWMRLSYGVGLLTKTEKSPSIGHAANRNNQTALSNDEDLGDAQQKQFSN